MKKLLQWASMAMTVLGLEKHAARPRRSRWNCRCSLDFFRSYDGYERAVVRNMFKKTAELCTGEEGIKESSKPA
ncbi:hypothetical protein Y032_0009g711 [Ancylostoma ceylanicum]|uniref:Uncharacterized protein n=1 Tax=Ancylostoma ceylanicum TaxID=53326 RepID=A0A016VJD9_9BILA|nr:hypothetical protein Y032_0009g711 [Ancylostoma ceylanicum]